MVIKLESLSELTSWEAYREFMKVRLKQLEDGECPFYLSKKRVEFEVRGKPWKAYAVLIGKKGMLAAKKIRKEGVLFHEGVCRADGKQFEVEGVPEGLLKFANLTLKKMRLGYSIAGVEDDEEDAPGQPAERADRDQVRRAARDPLVRAPDVWRTTRRQVEAKLEQLKGAIRKAFASEGADLVAEVEQAMKTLDRLFDTLNDDLAKLVTAANAAPDAGAREKYLKAARALLGRMVGYVTSDPLIAHIDGNPFGVKTNLKPTLTKSLKYVVQALGSK